MASKNESVVVDIAKENLLSSRDLLAMLNLGRNTLMKAIASGEFPEPLIIAGQKRWTASMINEYIMINNPSLRRRQALIANAQLSIESAEAV